MAILIRTLLLTAALGAVGMLTAPSAAAQAPTTADTPAPAASPAAAEARAAADTLSLAALSGADEARAEADSLSLAPSPVAVDGRVPMDTLSLAEAYALAEAGNPMLAAARARTDALRSMEASAALPPDPQLRVGVMNASLPGLETDMPSSMAPSIELMQMVPLPGKLRLSGEIARATTAMAAADAAEATWMVRARAAMAFHDVWRADREIESMARTLGLLEDFREVAGAMYRAGEGAQVDVLRAGVEIARMTAEIERMRAMRSAAAARLNEALGRPASTPIAAVRLAESPAELPTHATLAEWALATRPLLAGAELAVSRALARERLARSEIWPDLSVGLQYGQRDGGEMGTQRMGSLMVGASIPIFAGRRQLSMRDEAAAMRRMAEAERADVRATVDARILELLADLDRARTLISLYRTDVLPQADAAVESGLASYRVGAVDFMTLLDASMRASEYERELFQLQADQGRLVSELEMTIGRPLQATSSDSEDR